MELCIVEHHNKKIALLLDNEMKIVKPVYDFLRFQQQKGRAFNTLKAYSTDLYLFWSFLEKNCYTYDQINPRLIADFIDYLRGGGEMLSLYRESIRSNRTINRILSTVHTFYKYQADVKEIDNPILMHEINRPGNMFKDILAHTRSDNKTKQSVFKLKESQYVVHIVKDSELKLVLDQLTKRRDILLYKMLYLTGARIQEILDLEIEAIPVPDMSKSICVLRQIRSKGKYRDLYVPMSLIAELDEFIMEERSRIETDHSYIFVSEQPRQRGKQLTYSAAYDKLKKIQAQVGVQFNFHDLRHTFCSNLIESGLDVSVVRIIMGHEHISTTQRYTHLSNHYIEDSLSRYWGQSSLIGDDFYVE